MIRGKCPICRKEYGIKGLADLPTFPFCSDRCRLIDLGRWVDGAYAIPSAEPPADAEADPDEDESTFT